MKIRKNASGSPALMTKKVLQNDPLSVSINRFPHYADDMRQFQAFLALDKSSLSKDSVEAFVKHLRSEGYRPSTLNRKFAALKKVMRFIFDNSDDSLDPIKKLRLEEYLRTIKTIKTNSIEVNEDRILTQKEIALLISKTSQKLSLIIEFLFHTGVRVSEMAGIRLSDIQENQEYFLIEIIGKGHKSRKLKVKKDLVQRIVQTFKGSKYLFETSAYRRPGTGGKLLDRKYVSMEIKKAGHKFLGREISAHCIRHSFATAMIKKTGNIKGTSLYLGHSSTKTTLDLYDHRELSFGELMMLETFS